jgi:hypothetical protein
MDVPPPGRGDGGYGEPPRSGMSGGMKAVIAILVAAVVGLGVALAVVAADDGDEATTTTTSSTTTAPTSTTSTTTAPETTTQTTTDLGTITEGSGGTEAP